MAWMSRACAWNPKPRYWKIRGWPKKFEKVKPWAFWFIWMWYVNLDLFQCTVWLTQKWLSESHQFGHCRVVCQPAVKKSKAGSVIRVGVAPGGIQPVWSMASFAKAAHMIGIKDLISNIWISPIPKKSWVMVGSLKTNLEFSSKRFFHIFHLRYTSVLNIRIMFVFWQSEILKPPPGEKATNLEVKCGDPNCLLNHLTCHLICF